MRIPVMFSTGNRPKGAFISITRLYQYFIYYRPVSFLTVWLETFTNCNFNEFFSFVKFVKITST